MIPFLRREALYLIGGFIVVFGVYLFITFDTSKVIEGLAIGLAGGIAVAVIIFVLDRFVPGRRSGRTRPGGG